MTDNAKKGDNSFDASFEIQDPIEVLGATIGQALKDPERIELSRMPFDVSGMITLGFLTRQVANDLVITGVSPQYGYDEQGNRTSKQVGMRVKVAAFGGTVNVTVPDADESTFAAFPRGARIRLISPEARVYPSGHGIGLSVSAKNIELVS